MIIVSAILTQSNLCLESLGSGAADTIIKDISAIHEV